MKKLYLIDGMALIYRSHYAMAYNPLMTSSGIHTSAIFGFVNSVIKIIKDENPDYLCITMDTKGPTFRHEMYDAYKANRKAMPDEIQQQIPIFYDLFKDSNIPVLELKGFEADDILGTLTSKINENNLMKYIVSGDKDLMQLVNKSTNIYSIGNKFKPLTIYNEDKVLDKWGIEPSKMIDYLSLIGDSSDNIPGVAGVGPKTALKLLMEYNNLENIYESIDEIKNPKLKDKLIDNKENALMSKELVTIDLDVPVSFSLDNMLCKNIDYSNLQQKLNKLEIYTFDSFLGENLLFSFKDDDTEDKKYNKEYILVNTQEKLDFLIEEIRQNHVISLDLETDNINPISANIVGISLAMQPDKAYYISINSPHNKNLDIKTVLDALEEFAVSDKFQFIGQNLKYDINVLRNYKFYIKNVYFDTMVAESLISPEKNRYNLAQLSQDYLNYKMQDITELIGDKKNEITMDQVPIDDIVFYACEDADIALQVYLKQKLILDKKGINDLFFNIEMPLVGILADVEYNGVYVDIDVTEKLTKNISLEIEEISKTIFAMAGKEFNINSPKQLSAILFDDLLLKKFKKRSTASDVLEKLVDHHPIAEHLLTFRHLNKLVNTYLNKMPLLVNNKTNRIHTSFNQVVTSTGRLSSTKPNFQNIPIKTEIGRKIRTAFKAQNKNTYIFSCDYSQIELRILAHFSNENVLIDSFNNDLDIHNKTASLIFNINEEEVNFDQRRVAKTINYSIIYGAGAFRISQELKIPMKDASDIIKNYFLTYSKIKEYIDSTIEFAYNNEYVETLHGRQRKTYNLNSNNKNIVQAEKRAIINMPIQGTAAELIKIAMINIYNKIKDEKLETKMILQIHDELLFEVPENEIDNIKNIVINEMQNAIQLKVPIKVDYNFGENWLEAH